MPSMLLSNGSTAPLEKRVPPSRPSAILRRTPWKTPVAVGGQGIYITLEDGRELIDVIGGVAVACIGNGHRVVQKAIKDQVDKLCCESPSRLNSRCWFINWQPP